MRPFDVYDVIISSRSHGAILEIAQHSQHSPRAYVRSSLIHLVRQADSAVCPSKAFMSRTLVWELLLKTFVLDGQVTLAFAS
jgi:hypothetical protein